MAPYGGGNLRLLLLQADTTLMRLSEANRQGVKGVGVEGGNYYGLASRGLGRRDAGV
jgi:hypothetical protein